VQQIAAYSITSSARNRNDSGIFRPRALAVVRLMTKSNLVGCSTGMSLGFAPRKILSHHRQRFRGDHACRNSLWRAIQRKTVALPGIPASLQMARRLLPSASRRPSALGWSSVMSANTAHQPPFRRSAAVA
jgi:hypothetical protein